MSQSLFAQVYALVRRIPPGQVATYGQIARLLGHPRGARLVGWAIACGDDPTVPWHRVVASGGVVTGPEPGRSRRRARLHAEGVLAPGQEQVDVERHGWDPEPGDLAPCASTRCSPPRRTGGAGRSRAAQRRQ